MKASSLKVNLVIIFLINSSFNCLAQNSDNNSIGDIVNNRGIITQGQHGSNYIFNKTQPKLVPVGSSTIKNEDGEFVYTQIIELISDTPQNNIFVSVGRKDALPFDKNTNLMVSPYGGGVTSWTAGTRDEYFWGKIQSPTAGKYTISFKIKDASVKPEVLFDVNVQ